MNLFNFQLSKLFIIGSFWLFTGFSYASDGKSPGPASGIDGEKHITLYGLDVPEDVIDEVKEQTDETKRKAAVYLLERDIDRQAKSAINKAAQEDAIEEHERNSQVNMPPEVLRSDTRKKYELDRAMSAPLHIVDTDFKTIQVDPLEQKVYEIPVHLGDPSTIIFFDKSGEPWPISSALSADLKMLSATRSLDVKDKNQLDLTFGSNFIRNNLNVRLAGYPMPLTFRIVGSESLSTSVTQVFIQKVGPNTSISTTADQFQGSQNCQDSYDFAFDKLNTSTGKPLKIDGLAGVVILLNSKIYLRIPYRVVKPFGDCQMRDSLGNYIARINDAKSKTVTLQVGNGEYKTFVISEAPRIASK